MAIGTCEQCKAVYKRPPSLLGKFCSKKCAYAARRKPTPGVRRLRYLPAHPLAPPSGLVSDARVVLFTKVGAGPQRCHWCGAALKWVVGQRGNKIGNVIADHLDSNPLNDAPENLVVSCGGCNGTRARVVHDDEAFNVRPTGTRLRGERRVCLTCGDAFVAWRDPRPNKGLYCSRSCARRQPRT